MMDQHDQSPTPAPQTSPSHRIHLPDGFEPAGMLKTLLDYRFTRFITVNIVQILYVLGVVVIALYTFAGVIAMLRASVWVGLLALVFSPLVFLISVLVLRVYLELIVVIFRIAENTRISADAAVKR
jgi:hypothetical protein